MSLRHCSVCLQAVFSNCRVIFLRVKVAILNHIGTLVLYIILEGHFCIAGIS